MWRAASGRCTEQTDVTFINYGGHLTGRSSREEQRSERNDEYSVIETKQAMKEIPVAKHSRVVEVVRNRGWSRV